MDEFMNFWCICPNCDATSVGYSSPEIPMDERCLCGTEMEGFRILKKEEK